MPALIAAATWNRLTPPKETRLPALVNADWPSVIRLVAPATPLMVINVFGPLLNVPVTTNWFKPVASPLVITI